MEPDQKQLKIVIVGGSLAGLMCGIALKHAGHAVTVVEKGDNARQSHMAGVCLGVDAEHFLTRHDRIDSPFSYQCVRVQSMRRDQSLRTFVMASREITSWDAYYFRLRANFDGYASSFYPAPPQASSTDGPAAYKNLTEVVGLARNADKDKMVVTTRDRTTHDETTTEADLVVGADGPGSFVRKQYLPSCQREYVGYIAWRGTVPEKELSESALTVFRHSTTLHLMKRHHLVVYLIPGIDGSLEPGERHVNFLWYTNETPAQLDEILVDGVDGHHHHNVVPAGRLRGDIWAKRLEAARGEPLPTPFLELVEKIQRPFVQVVTDFAAPRAAFEDGKVLLVGDALSLYRPHTAFSGTQAAFNTASVEDYVAGKMALREWEDKVVRYARLHWTQSRMFGTFYQCHPLRALATAGFYLWLSVVDRLRAWWSGEERLERAWKPAPHNGKMEK